MPRWITAVQALTRPLVTLVLVAVFCAGVLNTDIEINRLKLIYWPTLLAMCFWFGDRVAKNFLPALGEFFEKKKGI